MIVKKKIIEEYKRNYENVRIKNKEYVMDTLKRILDLKYIVNEIEEKISLFGCIVLYREIEREICKALKASNREYSIKKVLIMNLYIVEKIKENFNKKFISKYDYFYECEKFNGFGYRMLKEKINSPYIYSYTNYYERGKFINDGVYSDKVEDKQVGIMALVKLIEEIIDII